MYLYYFPAFRFHHSVSRPFVHLLCSLLNTNTISSFFSNIQLRRRENWPKRNWFLFVLFRWKPSVAEFTIQLLKRIMSRAIHQKFRSCLIYFFKRIKQFEEHNKNQDLFYYSHILFYFKFDLAFSFQWSTAGKIIWSKLQTSYYHCLTIKNMEAFFWRKFFTSFMLKLFSTYSSLGNKQFSVSCFGGRYT